MKFEGNMSMGADGNLPRLTTYTWGDGAPLHMDSAFTYVAKQMARDYATDVYGDVGDWNDGEFRTVRVSISYGDDRRHYDVAVAADVSIDFTPGDPERVE